MWLGRYAPFDSSPIDYDSQLADLLTAIDAVGIVPRCFRKNRPIAPVLVYDYERHPGRTVLLAYDPIYRGAVRRLRLHDPGSIAAGETERYG